MKLWSKLYVALSVLSQQLCVCVRLLLLWRESGFQSTRCLVFMQFLPLKWIKMLDFVRCWTARHTLWHALFVKHLPDQLCLGGKGDDLYRLTWVSLLPGLNGVVRKGIWLLHLRTCLALHPSSRTWDCMYIFCTSCVYARCNQVKLILSASWMYLFIWFICLQFLCNPIYPVTSVLIKFVS